ncbi:MAG: NUDIX hydrolase [Actinobacteria bacterium]|nr:NUDIX hydrolase [Actinomycetota bacterium]
MSAAGGFTHLGDELLAAGHVVSMFRSTFRAPDGREFQREVIRHPGAVSVVAVHDDGAVVLVRQFRAPLGRFVIEIPAGKRDVEGEPAEATARRELVEEVGLLADEMVPLATFHNSVGFCDEESHVFLARGLRSTDRDLQGIEEEHMEVLRVPLVDVPVMMARGEITDAKTVIGLLMALRHLDVAASAPLGR